MAKRRFVTLLFPMAGHHAGTGHQTQPPYTTPDASNVRPYGTLDGRARGGSRPGLRVVRPNRYAGDLDAHIPDGTQAECHFLHVLQRRDTTLYTWRDKFRGTSMSGSWSAPTDTGVALPSSVTDGLITATNEEVGAVVAQRLLSDGTTNSVELTAGTWQAVSIKVLPDVNGWSNNYSLHMYLDDDDPEFGTETSPGVGLHAYFEADAATTTMSGYISWNDGTTGGSGSESFSNVACLSNGPGVLTLVHRWSGPTTGEVDVYYNGVRLWELSGDDPFDADTSGLGHRAGFGIDAAASRTMGVYEFTWSYDSGNPEEYGQNRETVVCSASNSGAEYKALAYEVVPYYTNMAPDHPDHVDSDDNAVRIPFPARGVQFGTDLIVADHGNALYQSDTGVLTPSGSASLSLTDTAMDFGETEWNNMFDWSSAGTKDYWFTVVIYQSDDDAIPVGPYYAGYDQANDYIDVFTPTSRANWLPDPDTSGTYTGIHYALYPWPVLLRPRGGGEPQQYYKGRGYLWFDPTSSGHRGGIPAGCELIATYRNRLVLANNPPGTWWMSAVNDHKNWRYGEAATGDPTSACGGWNTNAGAIPVPLTALITHTDDYLIFASARQMRRLTGDPLTGGYMDLISPSVGVVGKSAWCYGPNSELYFLSHDGLYVLAPGANAYPQPLLPDRLPDELKDVDTNQIEVLMAYDDHDKGVHVYLSGIKQSFGNKHWYYDVRTRSLWPMTLPANSEPLSIATLNGRVLLGCRDGFVRSYDDRFEQDGKVPTPGDADISSYVYIGPLSADKGGVMDQIAAELTGLLDEDSGDVTWSILPGATVEAAKSASALATGTLSGGLNYREHPRARANTFFLKLEGSGSTAWALETVTIGFDPGGRARKP